MPDVPHRPRCIPQARRRGLTVTDYEMRLHKIASIETAEELQGYRDGAEMQGRELTPEERAALTRRAAEIARGIA